MQPSPIRRRLLSTLLAAAPAALLPGRGRAETAASPREAAVAIDRLDTAPASPPFAVDRLARGLARPWSLAYLPDGELLISEKHGGLLRVDPRRRRVQRLRGTPPQVLAQGDSGLLDIALDPAFAANRLVYLAYAEGSAAANRLALWRARLDGGVLSDGSVIWRSTDKSGDSHPGGRLLWLPDGSLLVTTGDGFDGPAKAQDLRSPWGKTLRLTRDGQPAPGNPFAGRGDALPEIWTLGHRNAQGLALHPETGEVWSHEHGPRGGDEVQRLEAGANYGWPLVTHGIDYDGKLISERSHSAGFARSAFVWSPSVAPSGLAILRGHGFAAWRGQLLVGALAARCLLRLRVGRESGLLIEEERLLGGLRRRIRDVREAPDGSLHVLTDDPDGELLRLQPRASRRRAPR